MGSFFIMVDLIENITTAPLSHKKDEFKSFVRKWIALETVVLRKLSQM